jgi:hypothetical protein
MPKSPPYSKRYYEENHLRTIFIIPFTLALIFLLTSCSKSTFDTKKEEDLVAVFHNKLNNEAYEEIYNNASEDFQKSGNKSEFVEFLKTIRTTLGAIKSESIKDWSINNTSTAHLVNLTVEAHFEKDIAAESFVFSTQNKVTKLHRYSIKSDYLLNNK